jgi:hypothetical protein
MHSRAQFPLQVLLLTAALCLGVTHTGHAVQINFSGTVAGTFSSPVLHGTVIDANGNPQAVNNGGPPVTAVCSLSPCIVSQPLGSGSNTFTWGNTPTFSSLVFTGATLQGQASNTIFTIGTFAYHNGENAQDSLVFEVDFDLSLLGVNDVKPAHNHLILTARNNLAPEPRDSVEFKASPTSSSSEFCTTPTVPVPTITCSNVTMLLLVPEGMTSTATLKGFIAADPEFMFEGGTLPANDPGSLIIVPVPEPGSLILLGLGLGGIALTRRFRPVKR